MTSGGTSAGKVRLSVLVLAGVLVVGATGGAVAGTVITGADVKNNSLTGKDVKDRSLTAKDLSAQARGDLAGEQGPAGPPGPPGTTGAPGAPGAPGPGAVRLRWSRSLTGEQELATVGSMTYSADCTIIQGPAGVGATDVVLKAEGPLFHVYGTKTRAQGVSSTPTLSTMDYPSDSFGRREIGGTAIISNGSPSQTASEDGTLIIRANSLSHTVIYRAQVVYAGLDSVCTIEGSVIPSS